ncbi:polysaccharide pyruvyl transferase CsaB [Caldisalinibacter kiritimatiensis]|uniref:CsaB protein n=1 Tax=Caldisalinibacter kiritimatiensis TaxID=1304284 RepID=R1CB61_9FIRM|nr:polysaccharide pyruvyl transferase CsaB [Caldisalinibacter kiritimatiensis]EOC99539.1 CsaB protein [Caldisalinibacter kiritimatiensis]
MGENKRVTISGYYGFDNSGDDAILKAIVKDLKNKSNNITITALSKNASSTKQTYNIQAVDRFNIINVINELYSTDMLISGGGSLLQDVTSTRAIIYYLTVIFIAKLFKKPVMVYANGIGPIKKRVNKYLTKKLLNKVDLITLRDYKSKETLEKLGVKNKNIYVTSDPVFTLEHSSEERIKHIFNIEGIPLDKPLIGVNVRCWKDDKNIKKVISKTIDYLTRNLNINVVIIPMHYPDDLEIGEDIIELIQDNCYILRNKYSVEDMMGIIGKLDLIIAMRLHSLIYAATQAIPMIGLVYDPKVEGFLNLLGIDTKIDINNLELVELCTMIDEIWKNRSQFKSRLNEVRDKLKAKAYDNVSMALDLLKSR